MSEYIIILQLLYWGITSRFTFLTKAYLVILITFIDSHLHTTLSNCLEIFIKGTSIIYFYILYILLVPMKFYFINLFKKLK